MPKKQLRITVILLFIFSSFFAQNPIEKEVEDLYIKSRSLNAKDDFTNISFKLLKKATEAKNDDKIIYALYSIAQSYFDRGMYSKALFYCNKVINSKGSDKHFSKLYALRVMSFCYSDLGLTQKAFETNNKALAMTSKITPKNTDYYHLIKGLLYRDKSTYYTDYDSILKYDKKNLEEFLKIKGKFTIAGSLSMPYNNVGYDYLVKKNYDSAWQYYKKAEYHVKKDHDEYNYSFVYQSFGEYYEATNKADSALIYFKKSLSSSEKFKDYKLAKAVTDHIREIYLKKGDKENSIKYNDIFFRLSDSINLLEKKELNKVVSTIEKDKDNELTKSNKTKYWIIGGLIILALLFLIYSIHQYYKNKIDYKKFTKIITDLENKSAKEIQIQTDAAKSEENSPVFNLSDEKESELIKKLNNFEKKEQYLSQEISLSSLAANFNTNVNYLSKIIKKYKDNNFNGYINELRINYITQKLRTNPEYLTYKIAYLAEECGFSSYSYFVNIFKQQTGITPSKFIDYLKKEERLT